MLRYTTYGTTDGTTVLIVHGLYGSARNWGVISKRLSAAHRVVTVDMRNHGDSPHLPSHSYADMAGDLAEVIAQIGHPVDIVGHSMGGKAAMILALTQPELVRRMVVADIAPVAYGHSQIQFIEAMQGLDLNGITLRSEADAALSQTVEDPAIRAFLLQSLDLKSDPTRWTLNLEVLAADMPKIVGWPEIEGQFGGPVLMLSGGASDYVLPQHRPVIKGYFPKARFAKIPGAGHWLHAEKPREFEVAVAAFLSA
ncbi:alpha/beta fold hydrolase [Actibacterium sp. 188UL27-1]|uniref:alpha/beta fold hydrolase n=1 Tax=Actibacterium sp. 188UL27-1 TaxID=2786961 RepID=UPI00195AB783|nr:alpha/beta fold hydrolase [Actibacterium sp. 188UL27-1]MBM7066165.1 alpha/beta fold hydrolase [Actibacterium sp. 188UL27-1]